MNEHQVKIEKFTLLHDWPKEILSIVEPLLTEFAWLVPPWCHVITVTYGVQLNAIMTCQLDADYRAARLNVGPKFLSIPDDIRRQTIIHELIHVFVLPIADYAMDAIEKALPDEENPKLKSVILEELRERNEQTTEDLSFVLARKLIK